METNRETTSLLARIHLSSSVDASVLIPPFMDDVRLIPRHVEVIAESSSTVDDY